MKRAARLPVSPFHFNTFWWLEVELQCQLDLAGRQCLLNLSEGRRTDVAVRQTEVGMVEQVEELGAELEIFRFEHMDILDRRKIPLRETWPLNHVAAFIAKLTRLCNRIEALE